ncbi:hypothetical protein GH714_039513 [Hevea brasiliensis]|uniref:CCT domain-containing protein n=1 Tax=Hevea brasiliensis TaxID=3981 RepID=A0A6A6N0M5_HEVBR|nr:hypothetical protein GH714_039513 [Hevea brasiliensis]
MVVPSLTDYKMGFSGIAKIHNLEADFNIRIPRIQCNQMPAMEHTNIRVGRYTVEERKARILRYLKKRNQRNFNKTIKYACRKTLADRRVRVRGRFARNNELCEDENGGKKSDNPLQEKESYSNGALEMKNDDDDWLQEAVASLMCVPYIAG